MKIFRRDAFPEQPFFRRDLPRPGTACMFQDRSPIRKCSPPARRVLLKGAEASPFPEARLSLLHRPVRSSPCKILRSPDPFRPPPYFPRPFQARAGARERRKRIHRSSRSVRRCFCPRSFPGKRSFRRTADPYPVLRISYSEVLP